MSYGMFSLKYEKYLDHLVEVGICNAVGEKQASEHIIRILGVVNVDVTLDSSLASHYDTELKRGEVKSSMIEIGIMNPK